MARAPLRTLRNSEFFEQYQLLLSRTPMNLAQEEALLTGAVVFLNHEDENIRNLGYRIVVMHANFTNDYIPLYDIAIGRGSMPIVDSIQTRLDAGDLDGHFFPQYFSSLLQMYEIEGAIFTEQQIDLRNFFEEQNLEDVSITAPTSYGKSELISNFCKENLRSSVCVLVPTKALLAQTKQRLLKSRADADNRQIITHPEMFQGGDENFVAVFTQERLLRFLIKHPEVNFDFVFVDEAHNLLGQDQRALLLAKVIILQKQRNPGTRFKYLTPFLVDQKSLQLRYSDIVAENYNVTERLKTERYYLVDCRSDEPVFLYDQYFDEFVQVSEDNFRDEHQVISHFSADKNIVFLNLPKKIEHFVRAHLAYANEVENEQLQRVCDSISEFLHSEYLLVDALRKGFVYHHGAVPDIVKLYVERAYAKIPEISHIICNSTLLEGVNIPAEKMFILQNKKGPSNLSKSQFRNLVGRVCRFSEIFSEKDENLKLLEPEIFLVGSDEYSASNANLLKFIKNVAQVDLKVHDDVENVLLEEKELNDPESTERKKEADEFLENVLPGVTGLEVPRVVTLAGRACFLNNISEIDVLLHEQDIQRTIDNILAPLETSNDVMAQIAVSFVPFMKEGPTFYVLRRLQERNAQTFYAMLIDWKSRGASYAEMIQNFINYWEQSDSDEVYVGRWGEFAREGSFRTNWINIGRKTHAEKVNLAIVRIKEEQDFVENYLLKYVELLNDLGKLDENLYLQIKYGTTNQEKIKLMNLGVNSMLAGKLIDEYSEFVDIPPNTGLVVLRPELIDEMRDGGENEILVFEAALHIGLSHEF